MYFKLINNSFFFSLKKIIDELRLSFLPPLLIYLAAGTSGMTSIVGTFYVKEYLNLSASFIASLGFWITLPWALKMPVGHLVDLAWKRKNYFVLVGAFLISLSFLIMYGIATPSESAAFGCLGILLLCFIFRTLSWKAIVNATAGALRVTVMAFLIIFGSATFSALLAFSGASSGLLAWATSFDFTPLTMLLIMFGILLILGMFMDQLSMMLLTVPIYFPLATQLGFDPIWFGVIILLALEISFTTPPFGLLLFVMKGVAPPDTKMTDIYWAAMPFILCALTVVALMIVFPQIALYLPSLVK